MPKTKRLHFKDIDSLRFFAFLPVFIYTVLYLTRTEMEGVHHELTTIVGFIKQNCLDFFFFISSFLLTSQALREYKYNNSFSLRSFYMRRLMRIGPLLMVALLFAFLIHPWIIHTLKLNDIPAISGKEYWLMVPNYLATYTKDQFVYLAVIWSIYMFIQFYFVWGIILKFFRNALNEISIGLIVIGVAARVIHAMLDTSYEFDTLAYATPIGFGAILAKMVRAENPLIEKIKTIPKKLMLPIYLSGLAVVLLGYIVSDHFLYVSIVPLITATFFSFLVVDQTFGKNSPMKLRNNKPITHLGKISFGLIVYQSILSIMIVIGIGSLDFEITSPTVKIGFALIGFLLVWIVADISFNFVEKPLLRLRREFKKI